MDIANRGIGDAVKTSSRQARRERQPSEGVSFYTLFQALVDYQFISKLHFPEPLAPYFG